jgi:RNA polymerase sigma factor (sigma-70 family)
VRDPSPDVERFTLMFDEHGPRVYGYVRRQCDAAAAQDVVSEVFLIAWQRRSAVPTDSLPWLLVVARNLIANQRRRDIRQDQIAGLVARLDQLAAPAGGADHDVVERASYLDALARLTDSDREALLLVAWDGLSHVAAATVIGCSARAFQMRLARARGRLAREVDNSSDAPDHASAPLLRKVR